ncbi:rod shape-determining protein MreC [Campylobacter devanensis]|uniref:Rod shape-determining protein MreC n=1 Tax=Campylobacter devanensis TaxID=3161138 RepID=A0A1X9SR43_9BACT|nr:MULTISPECIES: rod shape-determining protein MreC [Campylobacter]ARQ98695.1 rod shape-determining protein MreC [Campylobacter lanienae]MEE3712806.1 rod shape-determining protein MreC [Campylobacter sp. CLAX-7218-21]SUX01759.1 rod shape-determining protein MreC [Campylobacter lanienae]
MNKLKFLLIVICLGFISFYLSDYARSVVMSGVKLTLSLYQDSRDFILDTINEHFNQASEIRALREQNIELERSVTLLSAFAYKLDALLNEQNSTKFTPNIQLVRALSYMNIGDHDKVWIDFDEFDENKIYGLISQGKTAGIVINKDGSPLALLQTDPKSTFSVSIGEQRIAGIATGNGKNIVVKFIAQWLSPKVGDEVYTSGLDGIFFSGVPVGKITKVYEEELYKSAIVETDLKIQVPSYLYVVTNQ